MKKILKFLELKILALLVIPLTCFMACNINQDFQEEKIGSVAFSPTVKDASVYRWEYSCSQDLENQEWIRFFEDNTLGLGEVSMLEKNQSYYFGLRGYDPQTGQLIWEGYHCRFEGENKTPGSVSIQDSHVLITIEGETRAGLLT